MFTLCLHDSCIGGEIELTEEGNKKFKNKFNKINSFIIGAFALSLEK